MKSLFILLVTVVSGLIAIPVVQQLPAQSVQQTAVSPTRPSLPTLSAAKSVSGALAPARASQPTAGVGQQDASPTVNGVRLRKGQNLDRCSFANASKINRMRGFYCVAKFFS